MNTPSKLRRTRALLVVSLAAAVQAGPAAAQPEDARDRARALLQEGGARYEEGDYAGALEKFEAAHRVFPSPKILFNLGQAYRGLARDVDALEAFERFLAEAGDAPAARRTEAREAIAALSARVGQIRVEANLVGASISIDGRDLGVTPRPAPVRVAAGPHQVVVAASGRPAHVERVHVKPAALVTVHATLALAAAPRPAPPAAEQVRAAATPPAAGTEDPLSHAGQFGLCLRFELGLHPESGQRLMPGLSYGVNQTFELAAGAIVGKLSKGAWLGGRAFLLQGTWKPELSAGLPLFLSGEAALGLQAGLGLNVDLARQSGLFAGIGAALFPGAAQSADRLWLLATLGVQARL